MEVGGTTLATHMTFSLDLALIWHWCSSPETLSHKAVGASRNKLYWTQWRM